MMTTVTFAHAPRVNNKLTEAYTSGYIPHSRLQSATLIRTKDKDRFVDSVSLATPFVEKQVVLSFDYSTLKNKLLID